MTKTKVKRTTTGDEDFKELINLLDNELWDELNEDQATYDPLNNVEDLATAVVVYEDDQPVACGCFKNFDNDYVEIKRMFVKKAYRGKGLSRLVLNELENWAAAESYKGSVLETSKYFTVALNLYRSAGYTTMPNYGPYRDLEDSVCMQKQFD